MNTADLTLSFRPSVAPSLTEVLATIARSIEALGTRKRWKTGLAYRVNLVLDELVTNVLTHGRDRCAESPGVAVRIRCRDDAVRIELSDDGVAFDPLTDAPPVAALDRGTIPVGGLGLHLVRNMTQTMSYRYRDGRNCLTLTLRSQ